MLALATMHLQWDSHLGLSLLNNTAIGLNHRKRVVLWLKDPGTLRACLNVDCDTAKLLGYLRGSVSRVHRSELFALVMAQHSVPTLSVKARSP